jgi:hypothetical protein
MVRAERAVVVLLALAASWAAPGCEFFDKSPTKPAASPSPTTAALTITVAPDPLKILWVCPAVDTNCYGSLDSVITVSETAGVGGRVDKVDFVVRDATLNVVLTQLSLSSADIQSRAGTNRIGPMGQLAVRPIVEGYPLPKNVPRPTIAIDVSVQVTDDQGHVVTQTKRVPVT